MAEWDANLASGAFLVGLGASVEDDHALRDELDVLDIDTDQFGATEGASEADEQQGAIAVTFEAVGRCSHTIARRSATVSGALASGAMPCWRRRPVSVLCTSRERDGGSA